MSPAPAYNGAQSCSDLTKREYIAVELHKALLMDRADYADERQPGESCPQATARIAVEHADALLERLEK